MKPITSIKVVTEKGDSITMRLGDLFTTDSELKVINSDTTHHYTALMLLTTAITHDLVKKSYSKIYFTMIGADKMAYTIARTTEDSIILINPKGKESEIHKKYLIKAMHRFEPNETSIVSEGVRLYVCTAISRLADLAKTDIRKMETRAMDLSKWPCSSLVVWAKHHLNIPSPHIPKAKYIDDKIGIINGMLKLSATRNANIPKPTKKISTKIDPDEVYDFFMGGGAGECRTGNISGITFINLRSEEVTSHEERGYPLIYAEQDIQLDHLNTYIVICINNTPLWILVSPHNMADIAITWRIYESAELTTYARKFTRANMCWLMDRLRIDGLGAISREAETSTDIIENLPDEFRPQREYGRPSVFHTAVVDDAPELVESVRVLNRPGSDTFKWGSVQAAEALSNNSGRWEAEEDEILVDDEDF